MTREAQPKKTCSIAGCERTHYAKSLCRRHYLQWNRRSKSGGSFSEFVSNPSDRFTLSNPVCTAPGCDRTRIDSEYCAMHRQRVDLGISGEPAPVKTCSVSGCSNEARSRGMCNKHYQAWYRENSDAEGKLKVPHVK